MNGGGTSAAFFPFYVYTNIYLYVRRPQSSDWVCFYVKRKDTTVEGDHSPGQNLQYLVVEI